MDFDHLRAPPNFVGRERELDALASHLLAETSDRSGGEAFVHGPTGVGKTALVAEFARRHLTDFPGGVHYLPSFASGFETPPEAVRAAEVTAEHFEPTSRALVVIEEVTDADPVGAARFVQTLRQMRPRARVILTSQLALTLSFGCLYIPLGGLPDAEMEALLSNQHLDQGDLRLLLSGAHGNPLLAATIAELAKQGEGLEHLLARLNPASYPGLLGPDGRPIDSNSEQAGAVGAGLRAVSVDLVNRIEKNPDQVHALSSREFEELVAAIYEKHGFDVELTPPTRDGGFDIYAARYEPYGKVLTLVECKRNAPHRPVGVELVRSLHGVVEDKGANVGVLATTSTFTDGAKKWQQRHQLRLALQDWFALQDMMGATADRA